eukprot:7506080-Pyramimonas_sp.AAC.1
MRGADLKLQQVAVEKARSNGLGAHPIVRAKSRASCRVILTHVILRTAVDPRTVATGNRALTDAEKLKRD